MFLLVAFLIMFRAKYFDLAGDDARKLVRSLFFSVYFLCKPQNLKCLKKMRVPLDNDLELEIYAIHSRTYQIITFKLLRIATGSFCEIKTVLFLQRTNIKHFKQNHFAPSRK